MKQIIALIMLSLIGLGMVSIVAEMPVFGDPDNPANNQVSQRYLEKTREETGSLNTVSAIITDYRAFDTLGEATVLFGTVAAIYATLIGVDEDKNKKNSGSDESEV